VMRRRRRASVAARGIAARPDDDSRLISALTTCFLGFAGLRGSLPTRVDVMAFPNHHSPPPHDCRGRKPVLHARVVRKFSQDRPPGWVGAMISSPVEHQAGQDREEVVVADRKPDASPHPEHRETTRTEIDLSRMRYGRMHLAILPDISPPG